MLRLAKERDGEAPFVFDHLRKDKFLLHLNEASFVGTIATITYTSFSFPISVSTLSQLHKPPDKYRQVRPSKPWPSMS